MLFKKSSKVLFLLASFAYIAVGNPVLSSSPEAEVTSAPLKPKLTGYLTQAEYQPLINEYVAQGMDPDSAVTIYKAMLAALEARKTPERKALEARLRAAGCVGLIHPDTPISQRYAERLIREYHISNKEYILRDSGPEYESSYSIFR